MNLDLDKSNWERVTFGDVVESSKEKCDPYDGSVARYVAGDHMETDELEIRRWGEVGDGYLGPAFHRRFRPGQVLYGSRRTYLRKVAVAEFDGVCANTTFVVQPRNRQVLLPEFLPWVMTSERFHSFSIAESKGSVNPYVNWSDVARYEFDLPPLDEQKEISDLLWAIERDGRAMATVLDNAVKLRATHLRNRFADVVASGGRTVELDSLVASERPICYGILKPGAGVEDGVSVVKVKDFPNGRINESNLLLTTHEIASSYKRSTLTEGDLLISIRGTIGRLAEVPESLDGANITQDTARLSIADTYSTKYVRLALESDFVQEQIRRQVTGLAVKGLNIGALRKIEIPVPGNCSVDSAILHESGRISEMVSQSKMAMDRTNVIKRVILNESLGRAL